MKEMLNFFMQHWQLTAGFILALGAFLVYEYMISDNSDAISPEQAVVLMNHEHGVVVDVRTEAEFKTGHILDAINIDQNELDTKFKKLNKYISKPIILVCVSGKRSGQCVSRLKQQGFARVYTMSGGMNAWKELGLPIVNN